MTPDPLTAAVAFAMRTNPGTLRQLARDARVPVSTLSRVVSGQRAATPAVGKAVARALRRWVRLCQVAAERIEQATG